jgi:hypothetical protein
LKLLGDSKQAENEDGKLDWWFLYSKKT